MALTLDKTFTKAEILTRYLNLVSFGNGAFGVQDAAQTYFGINASQLNWQQAALLAGWCSRRARSTRTPIPEAALATAKRGAGHHDREPAAASRRAPGRQGRTARHPAAAEPAAGRLHRRRRSRFFCDYVLDYLARAGISKEQVARGGYLIRTTLDPKVQASVKSGDRQVRQPDARTGSPA